MQEDVPNVKKLKKDLDHYKEKLKTVLFERDSLQKDVQRLESENRRILDLNIYWQEKEKNRKTSSSRSSSSKHYGSSSKTKSTVRNFFLAYGYISDSVFSF